MNKLQLYITRSGKDFKSIFNLNPVEDVRAHVTDLADAVNLINYDADEKNVFYVLTSTADGVFITVVRTIPPAKGHHVAAWIFVPADIDIDPAALLKIVRMTTRKVSNPEVTNADVNDLRTAFGTEYPTLANAPAMIPGRTAQYGWRSYGTATTPSLADMLGRGRYQQSYPPYAGVLLIDGELGIDAACASLDDVALGDWATIMPPEKTDEGFTAHVFGRVLDRPLLGTMGAELTVTWSRPGFEDVTCTNIIDANPYVPVPASTNDSHKTLTPASFYITSQTTRQPLDGCSIRVNGREITADGQSFTHDELQNASVLISCEGHFAFSGHIDLASTTRALVQLQEKRKIYRFELPVVSSELGAPVRFEIKTKRDLTDSPIEGYTLLDDIQEGATRTNHLGYVGSGRSTTSVVISAVAGLALGILIMLAFGRCTPSRPESHMAAAADPDSVVKTEVPAAKAPETPAVPTTPVNAPQPEPAAAPVKAKTTAEAISYLDNNKVWQRDSLESYEALHGLYDDLNNFNTANLTGTWAKTLKASKEMQRVAEHSRLGAHKKKRDDRKTFNHGDDYSIAVQSYLNFVDP